MNLNPLVYYEDDFLSNYECDLLVEAAKPTMQRSRVMDKNNPISDVRTSDNTWLHKGKEKAIDMIFAKVCSRVMLNPKQGEDMQIIRYGPQQKYEPHYDTFQQDQLDEGLNERGGQRILTALIYLNDPLSGGGTSFPEINMRVDAKKGRMVVFHNCYLGTNIRHPWTKHGGEPVGMGVKWAANIWFREKEFIRHTV